MNSWTNGDGFQQFLSGADIVNTAWQPGFNGIGCSYTLTNQCSFTSQIFNSSGAVINNRTSTGSHVSAGFQNDYVSYSDLGSGSIFTWKLTATPFYNDQYLVENHDFGQKPLTVSQSFITTPILTSPVRNGIALSQTPTLAWSPMSGVTNYTITISAGNDVRNYSSNTNSFTIPTSNPLQQGTYYSWSVTANANGLTSNIATSCFTTRSLLWGVISGPGCVNSGSSATWTIAVSGSVGNVSYQWSYGIYSLGTGSSATYSPSFSGTVVCTISDVSESYTATEDVTIGCPSGCPYISVWDGSQFQQDNNILPQSEYPGSSKKMCWTITNL